MSTCAGVKLWPGMCIGKESAGDNTKVITTFTQENETVMDFLNEVVQEFEANQESDTTGSNDFHLGKVKIPSMIAEGAGSENVFKVGGTQDSTVEAISQITSLIEIIQHANAAADTKLDALATISSAVENSSVTASASSESNTYVHNTTNVKCKTINHISNTLNQLAVVASTNYIGMDGFDIGAMVARDGGKNIVDVMVQQRVKTYNKMLQDLASSSSSISDSENSTDLKADIKEMLEASQKSMFEAIGNGIATGAEGIGNGVNAGLSGLSKPLLYGIIGIVAVIVLVVLLIGAYKIMNKPAPTPAYPMYGGGLDDENDVSVFDDL